MIDYAKPPRVEGAPGTLTPSMVRAGMRVHSVHGDNRGVWVIESLNSDRRTMRIRNPSSRYLVDGGCTPICRMYPVQGETFMTLGEEE